MKTLVRYQFEITDPSLQFLSDAFHGLREFVVEGNGYKDSPDLPSIKSFANIFNKGVFSESDIRDVAEFLHSLAARARTKYKDIDPANAPWKNAVLKAADDADKAADELLKLFYSLAPNLRPIAEATEPVTDGKAESTPTPVPVAPQMPTPPPTTEPAKP